MVPVTQHIVAQPFSSSHSKQVISVTSEPDNRLFGPFSLEQTAPAVSALKGVSHLSVDVQ